MNRALKYRLWDSHKEEYWEPTYEAYKGSLEDITLSTLGQLIMRTLDGTNPIPIIDTRFVIEQFTGLQDKNGVDIYEGDIVSVKELTSDCIIRFGILKDVACSHLGFGLIETKHFDSDMKDPRLFRILNWNLQVIGNIHENPELIN